MLQDIKHQLERIKRGNIQSVTYQKKSSQTTWASSDKNKFDQATGYWNKNHKSLHRTRNTKTLQLNTEIQKPRTISSNERLSICLQYLRKYWPAIKRQRGKQISRTSPRLQHLVETNSSHAAHSSKRAVKNESTTMQIDTHFQDNSCQKIK